LSREGTALTPNPSPALRERGGHGLGIVDRRRCRIATATLPPATPLVEVAGGRGKVWGIIPPFLSRSVGEEGGLGGKVRAALTPGPLSRVAGEG